MFDQVEKRGEKKYLKEVKGNSYSWVEVNFTASIFIELRSHTSKSHDSSITIANAVTIS